MDVIKFPPSLQDVADAMCEEDRQKLCLRRAALVALRAAAAGRDDRAAVLALYGERISRQIMFNAHAGAAYRLCFYVKFDCFALAETADGRTRWRRSPWWRRRRHIPRLVEALVATLMEPLRDAGFPVFPHREFTTNEITGFYCWMCTPETAPTQVLRAAIADNEKEAAREAARAVRPAIGSWL
jgi:hypothetical protein